METLTLKAETARLLDLVIHALYTEREIFLRELISNASDALDRLRFEAMLRPELLDDDSPLQIRLEVDPKARTLTVRDNGIGMSRAEVIDHIGTIARSGTQEFASSLGTREGRDHARDLIGRFGVGFYSCFMVAERVTVETRRAGETCGTRWESSGDPNYTIADVDNLPRGTAVTMQLMPADKEAGLDDFTDRWVISRVVKRYADFVTHPIVYIGPAEETSSTADAAKVEEAGKPAAPPAPVTLNAMRPIWTRPEADVTPQEYHEFYRHISRDWADPLWRLSFKAEGRWEYAALLFVPSQAAYDFYYHATPYGLQLYSQRVMIIERCEELLPRYLRFMKGVVDAADLPLNVSRQTLQHAHHLTNIRRWLTRKCLETLRKRRETDAAAYETFWRHFGRALKEGVSEDSDNQARLMPLLLFASSNQAPGSSTSSMTDLAGYVSRMKPEQKEIYYIIGMSRDVIERSPHLEAFRAKGYEVLYLTDPVDELVVDSVREYEGHPLRAVVKGQVELGDEAEREERRKTSAEQTERLSGLIASLTTHLEGRVREVRVSGRLTTSPVCLASGDGDLSPQIERMIFTGGGPFQRRILEINPVHPIIEQMNARHAQNSADPLLPLCADVLLGLALLSEGTPLPDPAAFTGRLAELLNGVLTGPR